MRLLIAEDELDLAEALTVFFEKNHFSVDAVHNGFDAYEYASTGEYDAVILDVMMPKLDGIQVLERLRQEGRLELLAALLSGDQHTFETFRCEAPELVHLPQATYEWYCRNYLDRDYPFRMLLRCNGVTFPDRKEA